MLFKRLDLRKPNVRLKRDVIRDSTSTFVTYVANNIFELC